MKYRDMIEIVRLILRSSNTSDGSYRTRIMYEAFLSFSQIKEYLSLLSRNDLLEYDEIKKTYKITEKGVRLLELCNKLHEMVDITVTKKD